MDSRGFDYIDACRQASVKLSDRQYFIVFELVLFLSVSAQTPVNRILFLIILCVKIQPNALCVNSFKTKSGRNCIQLFFGFFCNRLKYLKCPLKWEVHCVCLLLFMGSQIASVIYLLFILTHCIFYSACSLYLPCLFPPSLPLYLPFHWQSLSFFPSLFFFFTSDPSLKIFIPSPSCMLPCLFIFSDLSPAPVEGQWSDWGPWSKCSVTCDTGTEQRQRRCSPSVHGWAECKGPHQESRECTNPSCSGNTN